MSRGAGGKIARATGPSREDGSIERPRVAVPADFDVGGRGNLSVAGGIDVDGLIVGPGVLPVRIWSTTASAYVWLDGSTTTPLPPEDPVEFIGSTDPVGAAGGRTTAVIGDRWIEVNVALP